VIKLLVADDSPLMRKLLEGIFLQEGDFDVRVARNGSEALELVKSFDPHVVTLDVQMPGMDGLSCLAKIMLEAPRPVVMISSLTAEGADATLEAMDLGAVDFVGKPSGAISLEIDNLRPVLIEKIRGAARVRINRAIGLRERIRHQFRTTTDDRNKGVPRRRKNPTGDYAAPGLVLIGTSTGGPGALEVVLPQLPLDMPWPVLVAQHMPAAFTGSFAKRLDRCCQLSVIEVNRPTALEPGTIYIGRGDADVIVSTRASGPVAMPAPAQADYLWHPSVERMVDTAMECYAAPQLVGVMLTGMGHDGAAAMTRLRHAGGRTIAEAESSAVVWGMPGELVNAGGADMVVDIGEVAKFLVQSVLEDATH
jgi:two-component system, chemotaxis family, protein-glutamate methylesterase/glutaminase